MLGIIMPANETEVKSSMASAMGASIKITGPARGMYLIIGCGLPMDSLVKSVGGEIALRFNGRKMLATLPFTGYLSLRANREISHIGPVTVDVNRLNKVAEMLSKGVKRPNNGV
jgi:hypothetical protein